MLLHKITDETTLSYTLKKDTTWNAITLAPDGYVCSQSLD